MKNNRNMEGFAMIEVLLAVVVLAIGLLASSRMQMLGLSFPNCLNVGCNPAELAATDLFIWGRHFRKGDAEDHSTLLPPNAVGTITRDGDVHKVKISWQDLVQGDEEDRFVEISVTIQ